MKKYLFFLSVLVLMLLLPYSLKATHFEAATNSIFSDVRASEVGDILTIKIYEDARAQTTNQTKGENSNEFDLEGGPGSGPLDFIPLFGVSGSSSNTYDGKGTQSRQGNLRASMTVRVVAVRSNGDLVVEGSRVIGINGEKEVLTLTGIVRPQDINSDNTVDSYNLADAQITYQGKGPASSAGSPGVISRVLNWIF
ncbi:MAG: flagellar basal body L-ring protein [candidate division Zixibacteria bacterium]|jgi:flagellar L-ring protein precursor FlgH|nr:flagellar basal body L-ring protein [candidate division Zixibacteria bacterium]